MRIVSEPEFRIALVNMIWRLDNVNCVTGPGRSGALASVYASHILGIPFIPFGESIPERLPRVLIIDTATETGKTLRKAARFYSANDPVVIAVFHEPPRVAFWYEMRKPQRYRHEQPLELAGEMTPTSGQ